jgi:predicted small secreted protein
MKKIALLTVALLALSTVAASAQTYIGKGKAPPPPVVTKG